MFDERPSIYEDHVPGLHRKLQHRFLTRVGEWHVDAMPEVLAELSCQSRRVHFRGTARRG